MDIADCMSRNPQPLDAAEDEDSSNATQSVPQVHMLTDIRDPVRSLRNRVGDDVTGWVTGSPAPGPRMGQTRKLGSLRAPSPAAARASARVVAREDTCLLVALRSPQLSPCSLSENILIRERRPNFLSISQAPPFRGSVLYVCVCV